MASERRKQIKHAKTLLRRAAFLEHEIGVAVASQRPHTGLTFMQAEAAALRWVLEHLRVTMPDTMALVSRELDEERGR